MTDLRQAAKAVVDRWDSPAWEWSQQGPTADLMADLRKALAQPEQEPVEYQMRMRPTWEDTSWSDWKKCSRESARDFAKTPRLHDWEYEVRALYTTPPAAQPEQEPVRMPCIGKDPRCPCQDGDACHYKDCGNTKAWPVPQAEPTPWRDMVVVTLVREGINKHRARELADHFAAQPEQEPLGWLDGNDKLAQFMHRDLKADHDKRGSATPREYTIPVYATSPQRKPLTDEEIQAIWDVAAGAIPGWSRHIAYARAIEAAHGIKEGT